uniref:Uncharacterized protein n=1 Tax=viral metagenome TaxID=1070528 RepID=A0A6C0KDU5_9ZZZZ
MDPLYTSTVLSVSRKKALDCEEVVNYLNEFNIKTSITSNYSTLPHKEHGCRLTQSITKKEDIKHIWFILKEKYNFCCAHLKVGNQFDGCILDFIAPSKCPKNLDNE